MSKPKLNIKAFEMELARKKMGVKEVAKNAKVGETTIYRLIKGKKALLKTMGQLAEALNVDVSKIATF